MTRHTSRNIDSRIADLEPTAGQRTEVLFRKGEEGPLVTGEGEPAEPAPEAHTIIISETVVDTSWERKSQEGA